MRTLDVDWEKLICQGGLGMIFSFFTHKFHIKTSMPVSKKLETKGELESQFLGVRKYAKLIHKGPYKKLGDSYKKLYSWIKQQNLTAESESIEIYTNDPRSTK